MLKEHHNSVAPESDCLRVGDCLVDLPRREVSTAQDVAPRRMTQKSLQVLLMLVSHQGKVVSREALLEWVWPDTMPTDDVVTQAIAQLRKAFGDDHDAPRYIETIAKSGYRLLAAVDWIKPDADSSVVAAISRQDPPGARMRESLSSALAVMLVAAALIAVAGFVLTGQFPRQRVAAPAASAMATHAAQPLEYETITSRPGRETDPSLSPDGALVAYAEAPAGVGATAIMVQTTAQVPPRQLSRPEPGSQDSLPVWSRDGRRIAFVRRDASGGCRLMIIAASGGDARNVGRCYGDTAWKFDWTPDSRGLLMGGTKRPEDVSSPLRLLDLASGAWRTLSYPVSDGDIDLEPRYSPDGRWIVFRRNLSLSDLWKMPAGGGPLQRLTELKGDIRGWDWMPDGESLILSFFRGSRDLYRYWMADGRIEKLTDRGVIEWPDVAALTGSVAFQLDLAKGAIFRYTVDGSARFGPGKPEHLFAASGHDLLPSVSADGKRLAYVSTRTLKNELWLGEIGRPDTLRPVDGIKPIARHPPVWSEAGDRLLVVAYGPQSPQLHEVDVESGQTRRLPVPDGSPLYATRVGQPGRLLVGIDSGDGKLELRLYDTTRRPWRTMAAIEGVTYARYGATDNRVYFTRISQPGLWRADVHLGDVIRVNAQFPTLSNYKYWTLVGDVPHFLVPRAQCVNYWTTQPQAPDAPGRCLEAVRSVVGAPSASRDGRDLYLTVSIDDNTDIGWATTAGTDAARASLPAQ